MRVVCAWELFELSENSTPCEMGVKRVEGGKSTRETLQHCMSLIASEGFIHFRFLLSQRQEREIS